MRRAARFLGRSYLGAVVLTLGLGSLAMLVAGVSPIVGFEALLVGALGGRSEVAETLVQATALLFPALAVSLAFRAGLFNIGAEGQLIAGGLAAGALGAHLAAPAVVAIPVLLAAGIAGGAAWGALAGIARARFGANEVIATLMLNVIAALLANFLVSGPLKSPGATGAETASLPQSSWLPVVIPDSRLTISLIIAVALAAVLRWTFDRTVFGYELRAAGEAPAAAARAGIDLRRVAFLALTLSGAIAGLGGATIVTGVLHRFNAALSPGYGFIAIAVALVGDLDPFNIIAAAVGFGILQSGALAMQASAQVPKDTVALVEGLIVLVLAGRRYVAARGGQARA